MKKTDITSRHQDSEQQYTQDDNRHFEHLMQLTHRAKSPAGGVSSRVTQERRFDYSDEDYRLFETLGAPLARFRRNGGRAGAGKASRGGHYTKDDHRLFASLAPDPVHSDRPDSKRPSETDRSSRAQEYSKSDLNKFHSLLPGQPEEETGDPGRDFLARSPRDRDVGKIKIKQFDQPGIGPASDTSHTKPEQPGIKVKFFD